MDNGTPMTEVEEEVVGVEGAFTIVVVDCVSTDELYPPDMAYTPSWQSAHI